MSPFLDLLFVRSLGFSISRGTAGELHRVGEQGGGRGCTLAGKYYFFFTQNAFMKRFHGIPCCHDMVDVGGYRILMDIVCQSIHG